MAIFKCTMLISFQSNYLGQSNSTRTGGYSESIYRDATDIPKTAFENLCTKRAGLLPIGSAVVGQRYQYVDPKGAATTGGKYFPSTSGLQADTPQNSVLCLVKGQTGNFRRFILRGMPDDVIICGERKITAVYWSYVLAYINDLAGWSFPCRDLQADQATINNITNAGVFNIDAALATTNQGDYVRVLRATDANGDRVGGRFKLSVYSGGTSGTLLNFNLGDVTGGTLRRDMKQWATISANSGEIIRVVSKKVGRPFGGYVGKASVRR